MTAVATPTFASAAVRRGSAVLTAGVDGYAAGTTGLVTGRRQGCLVFAPDRPRDVARWAVPRCEILVPPSLVLTR